MSYVTGLLNNIYTIEEDLHCLSMTFHDNLSGGSGSIQYQNRTDKGWMPELRELRLRDLALTGTYPSLSKMTKFRKLSKLNLVKFEGMLTFLLNLTAGMSQYLQPYLTHFALDRFDNDIGHGNSIVDLEDERNVTLGKLLTASKFLCSLRISLLNLPSALKRYLETSRTSL
jgi:hypothetical protein